MLAQANHKLGNAPTRACRDFSDQKSAS